ncbi:MAG: hypothetical protein IH931_05910, partial [candidate division Zixibacteria bacterium]|nr:hypothetical protein [candidate division Zixibacteria bacterium]
MKSIFRNSAALALFFVPILSLHFLLADLIFAGDAFELHNQPRIRVVYPKANQIVTATDSTFILGNVSGLEQLKNIRFSINDNKVRLYSDGRFLAFIPVEPDSFVFALKVDFSYIAENDTLISRTSNHQLKVYIPPPLKPIPMDTLLINGDYKPPRGDLTLASDDELRVSFHA